MNPFLAARRKNRTLPRQQPQQTPTRHQRPSAESVPGLHLSCRGGIGRHRSLCRGAAPPPLGRLCRQYPAAGFAGSPLFPPPTRYLRAIGGNLLVRCPGTGVVRHPPYHQPLIGHRPLSLCLRGHLPARSGTNVSHLCNNSLFAYPHTLYNQRRKTFFARFSMFALLYFVPLRP